MPPRKRRSSAPRNSRTSQEPVGLRIIGGKYRGSKLRYGGDQRVRPMKDRTREAIFNLIGPEISGKHAIDLFAGTGALGLEAISRGAARATLIEQHYPTAAIIRENVAGLGLEDRAEVVTANVFIWQRRGPELSEEPWCVFCSPPYDFFVDRTDEVLRLVGELMEVAPEGTVFTVESDARFDFTQLPLPDRWTVRNYAPAVVGIFRKEKEGGFPGENGS